MKHVYILLTSSQEAGGELCVVRYAEAFAALRPTYVLATGGPIASRLRDAGHKVLVLDPGGASLHSPRTGSLRRRFAAFDHLRTLAMRLRRQCHVDATDLIIATSLKGAALCLLASHPGRRRFVWWLQDRLSADYLGGITATVARAVFYWLPAAVIYNSDTTMKTAPVRPGAPKFVAYPPVAEEYFAVGVSREPLVMGSRLTIGMSGRLAPWKGQDLLLESLTDVELQNVTVVFMGAPLFGEEAYAAELRRKAEFLDLDDRVRFIGHRADPSSTLATWDIAVHASTIPEPFGMVVPEAMAAGCTVIAPAAGGPAEVIEDGVSGVLFRPNDATELADALRRVISDADLRLRLSSAGRLTAERFRLANLGPGLVQWLGQLLHEES